MVRQQGKVENLFFVISILIVILIAAYVLVTTKISFYDFNDLGSITKFPIVFWLGLSYLVVILYLSRRSERKTIIAIVLISFYLFAMPILVRENKADLPYISYPRSLQGEQILSVGHLDLGGMDPWDLRNWPGFFFNVAFISSVSGLPSTVLADYFPLLTITFLGIVTYLTLRLQLNTLYSSLGALWFIGSFWTLQEYFSSSALAYMMFSFFFYLFAKFSLQKKKDFAPIVVLILLFAGIVTTHLLTSFMILAGVLLVYILNKILTRFSFSKKKVGYALPLTICVLLASIFFCYQTFVINNTFENIVQVLVSELSRHESQLAVVSQSRPIASLSLQLELIGNYSLTIINMAVALIGIIVVLVLLFRKKETGLGLYVLPWLLIAGSLGVLVNYGGEAINRAFMFSLLPICYFALKFLHKRPKILMLLLTIVIILHVPATFTTDTRLYIPTTEFRGATFYFCPRSCKCILNV